MLKRSSNVDNLFTSESSKIEYINQFYNSIYKFSLDKVSNCLENKFIGFFLRCFILRIDQRANF